MSEKPTLTDADRHLIREIVQDAIGSHKCRFPEVSDEEFRDAWPVIRGMANAAKQVQTISMKILVTSFILFVLGLLVVGVKDWLFDVTHKLGGK